MLVQYKEQPLPLAQCYSPVKFCFVQTEPHLNISHCGVRFTAVLLCDHPEPNLLNGYLKACFCIIQNITHWNWEAFLPDLELLFKQFSSTLISVFKTVLPCISFFLFFFKPEWILKSALWNGASVWTVNIRESWGIFNCRLGQNMFKKNLGSYPSKPPEPQFGLYPALYWLRHRKSKPTF